MAALGNPSGNQPIPARIAISIPRARTWGARDHPLLCRRSKHRAGRRTSHIGSQREQQSCDMRPVAAYRRYRGEDQITGHDVGEDVPLAEVRKGIQKSASGCKQHRHDQRVECRLGDMIDC